MIYLYGTELGIFYVKTRKQALITREMLLSEELQGCRSKLI